MEPLDWTLVLFLPWQLVFGSVLALLFDARLATPLPSSSRAA
jgi:hypothetical protein